LTKKLVGTMMFAVGLVAGSATTMVLHPTVVSAQHAMWNMKMDSKSAGDSEMNAAMSKMSATMASMKVTGTQDRDFMMMMVPHHQAAVEMAKIELRRGTHPELKSLAHDIITSQDKEIGEMHRWLKSWYGQS